MIVFKLLHNKDYLNEFCEEIEDYLHKNTNKDEIIHLEMLTTKGPGSGISPIKLKSLIGKKLNKNISADVVIKDEDVVWD